MATYLARLSMSNSFSEKALENAGEPIRRLAEELQKRCPAEMTLDRFTYGVYKLTASSMEEAEKIITDAWADLYPDNVNDARVFVALCDGTDQAELMRQIYTGLYGSDSYLELTTDLAREIPVLAERGALGALRKQNYLFAVDSGCGMTTLLSSFGNFLQRMKAFDDSESRSYFLEYNVQKSAEGDAKTPDDVISALDNADKEKDYSSIGLNIEGFLEGSDFGPLRDFVRRLYRFQDRYVFVFRVPFLEKKALDQVAEALSDLALLKVVEIPPLSDVLLLEFLLDHMRRNGYEPDLSVTDAFFARIRAEKKDGRFYGFKTAEKIVNSMILEKARHDAEASARGEETNRTKLTGDDIGEMAQDKKKKSGYEELREMIGMEAIEQRIHEIVAQVKISKQNERLDHPCIHMRFVGAPGTGKTTVARILGKILQEEGVLRKGAFLEYSARSLVAEYVGQTAVKTASICREAYGSVLFLDEAYALYGEEHISNDYGKEALTTLVSEMENHRDDMLVIMAGYTDEMETLMKGNVGLRSRMPYSISFPNYTKRQLFEIFMLMVRKHFDYTEDLEKAASDFFESLSDSFLDSKDFSNGRFVRNLYERTWSKAALRTTLEGQTQITLCSRDFLIASSEKEFSENTKKKNRIGF